MVAAAETEDKGKGPVEDAKDYFVPPLPENEESRLQAIAQLGLVQEEDPVLNSLCKLMCSLLKVPSAGVSIVEREKQWYVARGGETPDIVVPRHQSICQNTFLPKLPSMFVVEDTEKDDRFREHPLMKGKDPESKIRFFAGAPLITSDGHRVGALCLLDKKPRQLTMDEYTILSNCAEMVIRRLERDHFMGAYQQRTQHLLRDLKTVQQGIMLCDVGTRGWRILYMNEDWTKQTGVKQHEATNATVWDLFQAAPESEEQVANGFTDLISQAKPFEICMQRRNTEDSAVLRLSFKPAASGALGPHIQIPESIPTVSAPLAELPYYFVMVVRDDEPQEQPDAPADVPQGSSSSNVSAPPKAVQREEGPVTPASSGQLGALPSPRGDPSQALSKAAATVAPDAHPSVQDTGELDAQKSPRTNALTSGDFKRFLNKSTSWFKKGKGQEG